MYLYPSAIFAFQLHKVFELGGEDVPAFLIDNVPIGANLEKYRYEKLLASSPESKVAASSSSMFEFVEQFQHRTLSMIVRSEPLPADSDEYQQGQVQTVVAKNFEKVVLNPSKNVFLLVYAPQCGGSIAVQPIIDQVAKEIDDPDVIIARMDGTRNDFPVRGIPLTHYPSAFFFPKGPSRKEDGQLNFISWDDHNGSKAPHNSHVPVSE
jgi:thiol-disulfide isomerase/thioredoxin